MREYPLIGAAGRFDRCKGFEHLVDAAVEITTAYPEARFIHFGGIDPNDPESAGYADDLRRRVEARGLSGRFEFRGHHDNLPAALADLDVLVVPSVVYDGPNGPRTEGFGRVAVEGFAVRTPVVASAVGGLVEIVRDGVNGLLVPPESPGRIADAVTRLLGDTALRTSLTRKAREDYESLYTAEAHAEAVCRLYERIVGPLR
jgi:glycosyltransferase involved in cell wall biosynthesis